MASTPLVLITGFYLGRSLYCGQCYKTFFNVIHETIGKTLANITRKYTDSDIRLATKSFIALTPVANIINSLYNTISKT